MNGIESRICRDTKSTGTISAMKFGFPVMSYSIPSPTNRLAPYIKPVESVQPGNGSLADVPMIDGLRITIGMFVLFY